MVQYLNFRVPKFPLIYDDYDGGHVAVCPGGVCKGLCCRGSPCLLKTLSGESLDLGGTGSSHGDIQKHSSNLAVRGE